MNANQAAFQREADRLNACITRFEEWVEGMSYRHQAIVKFEDVRLELWRHDGKWRVFVSTVSGKPEFVPLRGASIDLKVRCVPHLLKLVEDMPREQVRLMTAMKNVADQFGIPEAGTPPAEPPATEEQPVTTKGEGTDGIRKN